MTPTTENILQWALALPEADRAVIVDRLWESLETPATDAIPSSEDLWEKEIQQRVDDLRSGQVSPVSAAEFWEHVQADLDEPTAISLFDRVYG